MKPDQEVVEGKRKLVGIPRQPCKKQIIKYRDIFKRSKTRSVVGMKEGSLG